MRRLAAWLVLFLLASAFAAAPGHARRVALVIGVGEYQNLNPLPNPVADAKAVALSLQAHGFEVTEHYDLDRAGFLDALEAFQLTAAGADLALAYYSGHGMEFGGRNILVPTDAELSCESKEARRAVPLDRLFESISSATNQVVLLDACRNDPFPNCASRSARQGAGFRGLARIDAQGTIVIANATLPGDLASDGRPGERSPFTGAFLARLDSSPDVYFRDLLDLVAQDVRAATDGAQIPEITSRGGLVRYCLATGGCRQDANVETPDVTIRQEAARLLNDMGFLETRGAGEDALAESIRDFQRQNGLPVDGKATPTLTALLTTLRNRGGFSKVVRKPVEECPETDRVATKSPPVSLCFASDTWRHDTPTGAWNYMLRNEDGSLYGGVITEAMTLDVTFLRNAILQNAATFAKIPVKDLTIDSEEKTEVNGLAWNHIVYRVPIGGTDFVFSNYYGAFPKLGLVQVIFYAQDHVFEGHKETIDKVVRTIRLSEAAK